MSPIKISLIIILIALISGCSSLNNFEPQMVVSLPDDHRIQFQGKGAGAGIALMNTMGPMGIAIGVAIDEGIAKDIRESLNKQGFDIKASLEKAIYLAEPNSTDILFIKSDDAAPQTNLLVIKKYGFKTTGGEKDQTVAEVELSLTLSDGAILDIHFPNEFDSNQLKSERLETVKSNGQIAEQLLQQGLNKAIAQALSKTR